jgi:multicomponent Na+:H+ antiporter subunit G
MGSALLVIAALGLFLLEDALARQHAATKAGTLALGAILCGTALVGGGTEWWGRIAIVVPMLLVTLPVASHMLARAAAREKYAPEFLASAPEVKQRGEAG